MTDLRESVQDDFERAYGYRPEGVWSAPGRVNLIGEHTDYNDGFVFPFAIDRRAVLALSPRDDGMARVASAFDEDPVEIALADIEPDTVSGWSAYLFGVAWALQSDGVDLSAVPGFDVMVDSTVPIGSGLSSSAALECAMAVALNDLWRLDLSRRVLVKAGQRAENDVVGAPTGILDQSASLLGEKDAGIFLDCRSQEADVIPLGFEDAGLQVLVIDTKVEHAHATGGYAERRASCEKGARELGVDSLRDLSIDDLDRAREVLDDETFRRVRHVVTEDRRVLDTVRTLREQGPTAIGDLLDASHRSMRDDFEISVPELDVAVETASSMGAIGARMTGGGFGGSAIALVPRDLISQVQQAVEGAFLENGWTMPDCFVVTAADGAHRES